MAKSKENKTAAETKPPEANESPQASAEEKPPETGETKPPKGGGKSGKGEEDKTQPVMNHLVKAGLAQKQVVQVPGPDGGTTRRVRYIPSALAAGLVGFMGWTMGQAVSETEFEAGVEAFKNKTAGSSVTDRLAGKGGTK